MKAHPAGKPQLRQRFCSLRECLPREEVAVASAALCQQMATWPALQEARTVLTYLAFRNEPDPGHLFDLLPHIRWAVPRIDGHRLALHAYDPAHMVRHAFGMLEPAADLPAVEPDALDIALVPGVAFDRHGERLGFGGGFYDRFLLTTPALRVGLAYDACLVDRLPCAEHDQRMDWVMTQSQRIDCRSTSEDR